MKRKQTLQEFSVNLSKEWHPTKNGNLTPCNITTGSNKKVWWLLPYDVPMDYPIEYLRGKHFDFEWEAIVNNRVKGVGCPYLSYPAKAIWKGFNDLATTHPRLIKEWHPTKNGDLTVEMVSAGSNKKVWWYLPYDVPMDYPVEHLRGKHFDFEWPAVISSRAYGNFGCPFLYGREAWQGFNDLETLYPQIAAQWHPTKNKKIKPTNITSKSDKKIWWYLPYDVPMDYPIEHLRGKHFNFEWESKVHNRTNGNGCPYLTGHAVWKGFNDLATVNPELAKQWHPTKNKKLKPTDITICCSKKIWWVCEKGHEWQAIVSNRVKGSGCPTCSKELKTSFPEQAIYYYIKKFFKDALNEDVSILNGKELDIYIPSLQTAIEYDGKAYHKKISSDIEKNKIAFEKNIRLIRVRERECPFLADNHAEYIIREGHTLQSLEKSIIELLLKLGIKSPDIYIKQDYSAILNQIEARNKEKSLNEKFPFLAKEWHPIKNGKLTPDKISYGSNKLVWWLLPYDVPMDYPVEHLRGKHFEFEWQCSVSRRALQKSGCPFLSGKAVWIGFNDLITTHPELATQWHQTKNLDVSPAEVTAGSDKKVWWYLPYDVPMDYPIEHLRCKRFNFEWQCSVINRSILNQQCPFLAGKAVWKGFNDLATTHPEIAVQWHPTKNIGLKNKKGEDISTPDKITAGSGKKVWWLLPYDVPMDYPVKHLRGKHFDFEWESSVGNRTSGRNCPYLTGKAIWSGFNDLETTNPEITAEWHPTKNGNLKPSNITAGSNKKIWWLCENGKEFQATIHSKLKMS